MIARVRVSADIRKILEIFEKISIDTIEIMTTGRIELSATGRAVAANVKRLRKDRGWSLRALSEALSAVGRGLSQDAINKIENGAEEGTAKQIRRVDVDDLMAFAVAFEVNPATLLLPPTVEGETEITGGGRVSAVDAWNWVRKDMPLRVPEGDDGSAIAAYRLRALPQGIRSFQITTAAGKAAALGRGSGGGDG